MKTKIKELPESKVVITVEATEDEFADDIKAAYKTVAQQYKIPGFRRGKIPPKIIDARIGKDVVLNEVVRTAVPKLYVKAVKETGIFPLTSPDIEVKGLPRDGDLVFDASVVVKPKIELGEYKGVTVEAEKPSVTADEIDDRLDILRDKFSELKPVDRPVKSGDYLLVDYETYNGELFVESASVRDYMLEVSPGAVIPELMDKILRKKKNDVVEAFSKVPEDNPNEEIAGQEVRIKVFVKEIKEKTAPVADDEFAKQASEFDTIVELKNDIKQKIAEQKKQIYDRGLRQKVLDKVIENTKMDLSNELIDAEAERTFNEFTASLDKRGLNVQQYYELTSSNEEALKQQTRDEAEKMIKNELVLDKVAEVEEIDVSKEDIDAKIESYSKEAKKPFDEYKKELEERGMISSLETEIRFIKSLDWLVDNAKIIDKIEKKSDNKSTKKVAKEKKSKKGDE